MKGKSWKKSSTKEKQSWENIRTNKRKIERNNMKNERKPRKLEKARNWILTQDLKTPKIPRAKTRPRAKTQDPKAQDPKTPAILGTSKTRVCVASLWLPQRSFDNKFNRTSTEIARLAVCVHRSAEIGRRAKTGQKTRKNAKSSKCHFWAS